MWFSDDTGHCWEFFPGQLLTMRRVLCWVGPGRVKDSFSGAHPREAAGLISKGFFRGELQLQRSNSPCELTKLSSRRRQLPGPHAFAPPFHGYFEYENPMSKLSRSLHQAIERLSKNSVSRNEKIGIRKISVPARAPFWRGVQAAFNHIFVDYLLVFPGKSKTRSHKMYFLEKRYFMNQNPE